jgi:hypothetical protein
MKFVPYLYSLPVLNSISTDMYNEAEFLDEIQTKVLRVFLLVIHSLIYSFALGFIIYISSNSCNMQTIKEENLIENHTPFPTV